MSTVRAAVAATLGTSTTSASPFDTLIGELDLMSKAFPPEKKKAEGEDEDDDKEGDGKGGKKGEKGDMVKSFAIKLENGETVEVADAGEMLKSLTARFEQSEEKVLATLTAAVQIINAQGAMLKSQSDKLATAETAVAEHATTITSQGDLIKSLQSDLAKFGNTGAGRKAVLSVTERTTGTSTAAAAKSGMPDGVTPDVFFAKAMDKQSQGRITGADIALAESCLNHGMAIPDTIVSRVLAN